MARCPNCNDLHSLDRATFYRTAHKVVYEWFCRLCKYRYLETKETPNA